MKTRTRIVAAALAAVIGLGIVQAPSAPADPPMPTIGVDGSWLCIAVVRLNIGLCQGNPLGN